MEETKSKINFKASVDNKSPKKPKEEQTFTETIPAPASLWHDNDSYLESFPAGYRFCPLDSELIRYYLKKKIMNEPLPPNKINDVNLYQFNPHDLTEIYKGCEEREKEFYFFTPRDRKYPNGTRPNRAAGDGYWKATGADKSIKFNDDIIGFKKTLVFYEGKPPKGDKTFWIMHEYRVNSDSLPSIKPRISTDMRLDDWVLCRIYYKERVDKSLKSVHRKEDHFSSEETNEAVDFTGYMHNLLQQNAVSQISSFKDVPMSDRFQHDDGASLDMVFGCDYITDDIFWRTAYQDNFCFESQLDFTDQFEDNSIVEDLRDNFHKESLLSSD